MGDNVALIPEAKPMPVYLEQWDITVPFVRAGDGPICVAIKHMCLELKVDPERQMQKIWDDDRFNQKGVTIFEYRVPTPGGRQVMWCLRKAEAAAWVGQISTKRVKESVRGKLGELQVDLIRYADKLMFGDMTGVVTVATRSPAGGELDVGSCPRCNAHLLYVVTRTGSWLKIIDESPQL